MKSTTILNKLKKELKITKVTPTLGLSNDNYLLDNKYHLKISYDNHFPLCTDFVLQDAAYNIGLGVKVIKNYSNAFYQLSEYEEDLKSLPENKLTYEHLDKIIYGIKVFHTLPYSTLKEQSIKELCHQFLLCQKKPSLGFLEIFTDLPKKKNNVPLHLDLVMSNILFDKKNDIKIIDYDLAIVGQDYLDLVSLLSENHFTKEQETYLINKYFENEKDKEEFLLNYPIYKYYFDLLWSIWAKVRKSNAPSKKKKIYEEIEKEKFFSANRFASTEY